MNKVPLAFVVSRQNSLALELIARLEEKKCEVIRINNVNDFKTLGFADYVFLIQGFSSSKDFISALDLKKFFDYVQFYKPKVEIILPYVLNSVNRSLVEEIAVKARKALNSNLTIVYLGELFGGEGVLFSGGFLGGVIKKVKDTDSLGISNFDFDIYLVHVNAAVNILVKGIFSYGFHKKEVVIANKISVFSFFAELKSKFPNLKYFVDATLKPTSTISNFDFVETNFDENEFEKMIASNFSRKVKERKVRKIVLPRIPKVKNFFIVLFFLFWVLSLPFLSFFVSSFALKEGIVNLEKFNFPSANFYFEISRGFSNFSRLGFWFFDDGRAMSNLVYGFSSSCEGFIKVYSLGQKIVDGALGSDPYDLGNQSRELYLEMDDLYRKVSYLIADRNEFKGRVFFLPNFDLKEISKFLASSKDVVKLLPTILGTDKQTNYLVLVQDKKEIRPTGGKIVSFGILGFDKGKLVAKNFYDAANFDNQLKGHVDPPYPLLRYLGIGNWNFSNSNWSSDFAASATRAEWFLKNEINQPIDGVIAIDNQFFAKLTNKTMIANDFFQGLQSKKIQMFSNDENLQKSLANLGWEGDVNFPRCFGNCVSLPIGIVEANLGGNKVGDFISRNANLQFNLVGGDVYNRLEINFTNSSKTDSYKNYLRVLAPLNANFDTVTQKVGKKNEFRTAEISKINDRTEAGTFIEIPPVATGQVIFTWKVKNSVDYSKPGKILFYIRHQSGIDFMPIEIRFQLPTNLTGDLVTSYNTNLESDFIKEIDF